MGDALDALRGIRPVHLFLLWEHARPQEQRILADLDGRFTVLDLAQITWSGGEAFARSLSRMYGSALPPGSDKERHCGTGPMLAVTVLDPRPRYRLRRTNQGRRLLNAGVIDARARYREWTGGGHRVHASDCARETEQNLLLLLGTRTADVRARRGGGREVRTHDADPAGTHGWSSVEQLAEVLRVYHCDDVVVSDDGTRITGQTIDLWWAGEIAGGMQTAPGTWQVPVAGGTVELSLVGVEHRRQVVPRLIRRSAAPVAVSQPSQPAGGHDAPGAPAVPLQDVHLEALGAEDRPQQPAQVRIVGPRVSSEEKPTTSPQA